MPLMPPISQSPTDPTQDMTSTAQQVVDGMNDTIQDDKPIDPKTKKRYEEFRSRIDICKLYRRKLIANWTVSIDYRRGKPFSSQTDQDQIAVNLDWVLTKSKQASLFSQVPQIHIDHSPQSQQAGPWVKIFEQALNDNLVEAGIEAAMDECLPDCINAAGLGAILVSYEALTEDRQVPSVDPSAMSLLGPNQSGQSPSNETIPFILDKRYNINRVSPADLLWPINFTGSDFNKGPWIGRSGRITWADSVQRWKLKEEDKESVLGEDRPMLDKLTHDVERDKVSADEMVGFDEIFYWEYQYNEDATSYKSIHHLVFVNGKELPVVDEPWKGQKQGPQPNQIIGARRFPIQVLTLSYLSDEAIPPSDSAIGRPQVDEINKSRTQMIRQRERSLPVRWFNVNGIDPSIAQGLMRGTWQTMIPVQGDGQRLIGEVARAVMPPENFTFYKIARVDLNETWTVSQDPEQDGTGETEGEQKAAPGVQTRINRERAKVSSFVTRIAEVLGGLMCIYEDPSVFGQGFDPSFSSLLTYSILADSTVLLDANQRLFRLNQFMNSYAKSGLINVPKVLQEIAILSGLDPTQVIAQPQPKPPAEPNISLRLTGVEDLLNPLALAVLIKSGQAPSQDLIEQAKQLIQQAVTPPPGMQMPSSPMAPGGLPMMPAGPGGAPLAPNAPAPPPGSPLPQPPPPAIGDAHPEMTILPKINKRADGGE